MIQRIQTLFLLAAVVVQILFLSFPIAHFVVDSVNLEFYAIGFKSNGEVMAKTLPLFILSLAILFLTVVDIFLYKKRILQIRICMYTILLNIGLAGMMFLNISNFMKVNTVTANSFGAFLVAPAVSIILLFLAFRGIRKDELLLKAYDRLR